MVHKHIKKHKGKVGLALLLFMIFHYSKLWLVLGISGLTDLLNVWLGSEIGFNIGSIIVALGSGLIIWKIMGGK